MGGTQTFKGRTASGPGITPKEARDSSYSQQEWGKYHAEIVKRAYVLPSTDDNGLQLEAPETLEADIFDEDSILNIYQHLLAYSRTAWSLEDHASV
ncbi:hypothetical protein K469DRAFT_702591 [Zopfia rhizophila CBS 207.26]|uniref:Uncharacterized protein n=1 Tax=Zopfia rhizophila CBS 207.26 TaxID=1314779 RepID=A0A6A6EE95_9PEZI|nr:hypothetical protein K469DRAFT_702591 [Zopfia rhizophila CBS 207.26]